MPKRTRTPAGKAEQPPTSPVSSEGGGKNLAAAEMGLGEYLSVQGLKGFIDNDLALVDSKEFHIPGTQFRGRGITAEQFEAILSGYVRALPVHAELTTQEAADHLNVSRPFLIRLLEEGKIPFRKVGTHRRVKFSELEAFRRKAEEERITAMEELAAQSQALGMGY